jgi:hypothetical protein
VSDPGIDGAPAVFRGGWTDKTATTSNAIGFTMHVLEKADAAADGRWRPKRLYAGPAAPVGNAQYRGGRGPQWPGASGLRVGLGGMQSPSEKSPHPRF